MRPARRRKETKDSDDDGSSDEEVSISIDKKNKRTKPSKQKQKQKKKQKSKQQKDKKRGKREKSSDDDEESDTESGSESSESSERSNSSEEGNESDDSNSDEKEATSNEDDDNDDVDDDDNKHPKKKKSKKKQSKRSRRRSKNNVKSRKNEPPLPVNGNMYFVIMIVCQIVTIALLFGAYWSAEGAGTYVFMIALNCVVVALEIMGYRTVIYEKFKDFTTLWKDRKQPAERKMNSIITVTTTNTALMFVMFLVQGVAVITLFFSIPSLVLQADVWSYVTSMTKGGKVIFSLLLIFALCTFICVWKLTYALLYAVGRGCILLEANNYDRLIGESFRIAFTKAPKLPTQPPAIKPAIPNLNNVNINNK